MTVNGEVAFHGLLFVKRGEVHANLPARADPLDSYALCAAACARSFERWHGRFRVVTNDAATLSARYAILGVPAPAIIEHRFAWTVPPIPFRAAHRKLELFRAFADGSFGPAVALVDIDTVLRRPWPHPVEPGVLQSYDITDAIAASRVADDLRLILGRAPHRPVWWGGEFIAGDRSAFAMLADGVERLWPGYLAIVDRLDHIGDEAVTSAALAEIAAAGGRVRDVGGAGVQRWWSARTGIRQAASLSQARHAALMHLPADKPFLARYADPARSLDGFDRAYRRHVAAKLAVRHLATMAERLIGRPAKHVARL